MKWRIAGTGSVLLLKRSDDRDPFASRRRRHLAVARRQWSALCFRQRDVTGVIAGQCIAGGLDRELLTEWGDGPSRPPRRENVTLGRL